MNALNRVLHVEDDPSIRMIVSLTLEKVGNFTVLSCDGGQQALDQVDEFKPQVILLDVMMPGMDGPETLLKLGKRIALDDVLVLFMTAKVQDQEVEYYKSIGARDVIIKPFDPATLCDELLIHWKHFHNA